MPKFFTFFKERLLFWVKDIQEEELLKDDIEINYPINLGRATEKEKKQRK
jgi:hypothetical protein